MHLTTLLTTLTTLATFSSLATAAIVQGVKTEKVGNVEFIVCPANAAPKDTVCDPTRRKIGVCLKASALAIAVPLKEGDWKCGDPNWVSYSTEVVMSTVKPPMSTATVVVTPTVTATPGA